jgi:hypothetical protein
MVWKKIGVVGVDSGQLLICDPCYIDSEWEKEELVPAPELCIFKDGHTEEVMRCSDRWFEIIDDINKGSIKLEERNFESAKNNFSFPACAERTLFESYGQLDYRLGHPGVGVVFRSGFGDGCYEVWANFVDYGELGTRIAEVKIKLISKKEKKIMKKITGIDPRAMAS